MPRPAIRTIAPEAPPAPAADVDVPEVRQIPEVKARPEPEGLAVASGVVDANRARSAGLLVLLLTSIGGVLAVAVAAAAVAAAVALRAALMG